MEYFSGINFNSIMATKKEEKQEAEVVKLTLLQKLLEIKKQVGFIKKDTKGHQYEYASPTAVLGKVVPLLNEHGVLLEQHVRDMKYERIFSKPNAKAVPTTIDGKTASVYVPFDVYETLVTIYYDMIWVDVDSGEERVIPFVSQGSNGDDKGVGSAMTYAERYFLLKFFNIATDTDDPDWLANQQPKEPVKPQPKAQPQAAAPAQPAAPKEKQPMEDHILQTMISYIKKGQHEAVQKRLGGYTYSKEQYEELVRAGLTP